MSAEDNIAEAERNFEENKTKLLKRFEEDGVFVRLITQLLNCHD